MRETGIGRYLGYIWTPVYDINEDGHGASPLEIPRIDDDHDSYGFHSDSCEDINGSVLVACVYPFSISWVRLIDWNFN